METERLIIGRFRPDDWMDLHEYLSQEKTVQYEPYDIFTEEKSKKEALKRSENDAFWAICLKSSGKLIGNIYLAEHSFETWELGYVFNADFLGYGYATEAARALIGWAFKENNFDDFEKHLEQFDDIIYLHRTKEYPWGQRVVRFYDPDSHIIEEERVWEAYLKNTKSKV